MAVKVIFVGLAVVIMMVLDFHSMMLKEAAVGVAVVIMVLLDHDMTVKEALVDLVVAVVVVLMLRLVFHTVTVLRVGHWSVIVLAVVLETVVDPEIAIHRMTVVHAVLVIHMAAVAGSVVEHQMATAIAGHHKHLDLAPYRLQLGHGDCPVAAGMSHCY